jgi:X-linked retinitis pigmentosa GTPase regulator
LQADGIVYGTGGNTFGQLGNGSKKGSLEPIKMIGLPPIKKISCGHHSGAISKSGDLYLWGTGIFGEYLSPRRIELYTPIKDISIGGCFGAAIDEKGVCYTWGSNTSGELGVGDYEARINPFPLLKLRNKTVMNISCGGYFAIALGPVHKFNKYTIDSAPSNGNTLNNMFLLNQH